MEARKFKVVIEFSEKTSLTIDQMRNEVLSMLYKELWKDPLNHIPLPPNFKMTVEEIK